MIIRDNITTLKPTKGVKKLHVEQKNQRRADRLFLHQLNIAGYFHQPALWEALNRCGILTPEDHHQRILKMSCIAHVDRKGFFDHIPATVCQFEKTNPGGFMRADNYIRPLPPAGLKPKQLELTWLALPVCNHHRKTIASKWHGREFKTYLWETARNLIAHRARLCFLEIAGKRGELNAFDVERVESLIGFSSELIIQ